MTLTQETIKSAEKEASEKEQAQCTEFTKGYKIGFQIGLEARAATEADKAKGLIDLLEDIKSKYQGSLLAAKVSAALAKYKEVVSDSK